MEIVVMEVALEEGSAVVTGVVGASVSPLSGEGLNETFGLAVSLGPIGFGEEVFEAEIFAGGGKEF